ncbi:MAG TPA: hypothetical protein VIH58_03295 [Chthoniobacterales bacterium]|jgi:hypothetical protein
MIFVALTVTRETIEDIRGPFVGDNAVWSIAIIAVLLVLAVLAYLFWPTAKPKVTPVPLPRETARLRLNEVRATAESASAYDTAVGLSTIVRAFVEQQYGLKTVSRTTQEFLVELGTTNCLNPVQKGSLQRFLSTADQIKFAHANLPEERSSLVEQATNLIEQAP